MRKLKRGETVRYVNGEYQCHVRRNRLGTYTTGWQRQDEFTWFSMSAALYHHEKINKTLVDLYAEAMAL